MNLRIGRDPYLGLVARRWGEAAVLEAGWFDDGDPTDAPLDDVGWLCTPIDIVQRGVTRLTLRDRLDACGGDPSSSRRGSPTPSPVVLLSTGGFFPVHGGHVAMMTAARDRMEADGRTVVGGYLSPAHDDYIHLKCGAVDVPVSGRLARAEAVVAPTGWLSIDPWEALARRVAVNFTDVTARLEAYLRHHVHPAIDVVYVCGADNARFALAFSERGGCVVVGRPGSEAEVERWRADPRVADNPRVAWVDGDDATSSRSIRSAGPGGTTGDRSGAVTADDPRLDLRLEDERAVTTLGLHRSTWRRFQDGIQAELAARVALRAVSLESQAAPPVCPDDRSHRIEPTISVDPMLPGDLDLAISRCFDLGGLRALGHVARPGSPPLDHQFASIPAGPWTLRDDDRATGSTTDFIAGHLPTGVTVTTTVFALCPDRDAEIADSRDFLLGTDHGGLVVVLPEGSIGRAPYLLPYVDPSVRSGLPGGDAVAFSAAVWELNASIFMGTGLTVAELPTPVACTMVVAGFGPATPLVEVCQRHATVLRTILS